MFKQISFAFITALIIIGITVAIIIFGRGYRLNPNNNQVQTTGLLATTSSPNGANVYINNQLTSATNSTINLLPGTYDVKITKDGYTSWSKKLQIKGEVVTKAEALLIPIAPEFRPLTTTGALNPILSPDGTRIAYGIASASAEKQGIWILDLNDRPLSFQTSARQIAVDSSFIQYSKAKMIWSPDSKQIVGNIDDNLFLLNTNELNIYPQDISLISDLQFDKWIQEKKEKDEAFFKVLKTKLYKSFKDKIKIISWSPDETKILYTATASATIPEIITPPLIGTNTQPEERNLSIGKIYVYDIKEDKNFYITQDEKVVSPPLVSVENILYQNYLDLLKISKIQWLSDSGHLILTEKNPEEKEGKISIIDYDNTNKQTVLSGFFEDNFVFPFPNSTRIIILTSLNLSSTTVNLYAINLK